LDGKVGANAFELSTADKAEEVPSLSVWAERLTTAFQAWELTGSKADYRLVIRLKVDEVRALRPTP
jgi:hypothetical protein